MDPKTGLIKTDTLAVAIDRTDASLGLEPRAQPPCRVATVAPDPRHEVPAFRAGAAFLPDHQRSFAPQGSRAVARLLAELIARPGLGGAKGQLHAPFRYIRFRNGIGGQPPLAGQSMAGRLEGQL